MCGLSSWSRFRQCAISEAIDLTGTPGGGGGVEEVTSCRRAGCYLTIVPLKTENNLTAYLTHNHREEHVEAAAFCYSPLAVNGRISMI